MLRIFFLITVVHFSFERDVYHGSWRGGASEMNDVERKPSYWQEEARMAIEAREARRKETFGIARNIVMFLGDGMSVPTLAAARALLGQRQGRTGEESQLSFEAFPTVGLAKTYCVDAQVADSACTATAYLCGAKANYGTIGVTPAVMRRHCQAATEPNDHVYSIAAWALQAGKDAGQY
ncbi:unnamed protein product [Diatraea saccharalis]|uniref:alkaline phosphatase n=1 Tax=Diatraea saccharalis TaxID=40085 RepID=A0A9N9R494_9NEOP|nr:unnamed protein product [Diatraea saccharalis]